eukprot:TRINITY_DN9272_c1_g1_i1.p2 TRINITY_DN9272_c1_g1~~TRINITY_DN9272_c1_g1_i1.p2  ORF type:complete len:124 (+),score=27.34 TRINITY_DN9272_c1_g1_i1:138-509(+)
MPFDPYLKDVILHLLDNNSRTVEAWKIVFEEFTDVWGGNISEEERVFISSRVKVTQGEFDPVLADAWIVPTTSFCFSVAQQDESYVGEFGWELVEVCDSVCLCTEIGKNKNTFIFVPNCANPT